VPEIDAHIAVVETIFGSESWAEVRNATHPDLEGTSTLTLQRRTGAPTTSTLNWNDAVRANLDWFAPSVEGRAAYPFTDEQIVNNIAVMAAVTHSAATGQDVSVKEMLRA
jgi:predicted dehydrogenase